ncbi:hypothetical protein SERLA73DRAFT_190971 [Serpula lacrymans var. lacrymans S7.3]|uniref:BZIP domain-containing protein n=2 Tax=Serpula lacrymans var. lacrymans TaxID=341189 RepID=F8QGR2_SERL3|nr:uncharacterized protein SERLADRAFT_457248 [Serpula lacrymans var. lacrymans S7.9]EGN92495.1 hypothetical protein SERLA73DRAFT_190971 [Serpula lacrymans var. lacrymans S7.3]EGO29458.1 hypothetical protein SERLADRAFT_457248 [Serpula lacrymans var. lacrymans S7.9]
MSSKEKRQLRNKISARNFRVRRKEYISTLEGDIAERDSLIDAIRTELGSSKSENIALRQEITALKRALLDGRGLSETPVLPPPAPLPAVSAAITHQEKQAQQSSPLITANTQKDLPTSPRLGARAFWGGMGAGLGGGGVTPVHTTFVPPLTVSSVLAGKAGAPKKPSVLQENINPAMNPSGNLGQNGIEKKGGLGVGAPAGGFDSFTEMNPFTLKTLDAYRMQLWGKMAAQQHAQQHYQQHPTTPPHSPPLTGLASGLRPHYFTSSKGQSTILSGKNAYPTPPNSPPLSSRSLPYSSSASAATKEQQQHAIYAAIASQTLLGRLGSAFWDAFSGSTGPSNNGGRVTPSWDAEKVRKVLEGKAVVKVVDVDGSALAPKVPVATPRPISRSTSPICPRARCTETLTDILEESMRSLTLNKK